MPTDEPDMKAKLESWISDKAKSPTVITNLQKLAGGYANELYGLSQSGAGIEDRELVLKMMPAPPVKFFGADKEPHFRREYDAVKTLAAHTDVPFPKMYWYEGSVEPLGRPFYIMSRVPGEVPVDRPPYFESGFIAEGSPDFQRRVWRSSIEAMAALHRVDWRALGLDFLADSAQGVTMRERRINYHLDFYDWARGTARNPYIEAARDWLHDFAPKEEEPVSICWGDARIGNQIFSGSEVVALIDFETMALGNPIQDIAYALSSEKILFGNEHALNEEENSKFPCFLSAAETYKYWSELTGFPATPELQHYYTVFSAFKGAVQLQRDVTVKIHRGILPADSTYGTDNFITAQLADLLGIKGPDQAMSFVRA